MPDAAKSTSGHTKSMAKRFTSGEKRLCQRLSSSPPRKASTIVTPDAALATAARDAGHSVISVEPPDSKMIAEFGWKKLQAGETTTPEQLEANYMRRSDAEIFVKKTP